MVSDPAWLGILAVVCASALMVLRPVWFFGRKLSLEEALSVCWVAEMTPRPREHIARMAPYEWEAMASDVAAAWKQRQRIKPKVITSAAGEKSVVQHAVPLRAELRLAQEWFPGVTHDVVPGTIGAAHHETQHLDG